MTPEVGPAVPSMAWGRMAAKRKRGALPAGKAKRARSAPGAGEAAPEGGPRERSIPPQENGVPPQEYSIPPPVSQVPPLGRGTPHGARLSEGVRLLSHFREGYLELLVNDTSTSKSGRGGALFPWESRKAPFWSMSMICVSSVSEVFERVRQFCCMQRLYEIEPVSFRDHTEKVSERICL